MSIALLVSWCDHIKQGSKEQKRLVAVDTGHFSTFKKSMIGGLSLSKSMNLVDLRELAMASGSTTIVVDKH